MSAGWDPAALAVQTPHLQTRKVKHTAGSWPVSSPGFSHCSLTGTRDSYTWALELLLGTSSSNSKPDSPHIHGWLGGQINR